MALKVKHKQPFGLEVESNTISPIICDECGKEMEPDEEYLQMQSIELSDFGRIYAVCLPCAYTSYEIVEKKLPN